MAGTTLPGAPLDLTDIERDVVKSLVRKRWDRLKLVREPKEKDWADALLAYRVKKVRSFYNGRTQLVLPVAQVIAERIVPNIVSQTVGRGEFFECRAKSAGAEGKARLNQALVMNQLEDDEFRKKYTPFIRDVVILGVGVWKTRWLKDVRQVRRPVRVEDPIGMGEQGFICTPRIEIRDEQVVLANRPSGNWVSPWRVWYDHRVPDENETDWVEESYVTADWLIRMAKAGVFDQQAVAKALNSGPGSQPAESYQQARVQRVENRLEPDMGKERDKFHYVEFRGRIPVSLKDGEDTKSESVDVVLGVVNNEYLVWADHNPLMMQDHPYRVGRIIPMAGTLDGLSVLTQSMGLIIEKNDKRNQALDNSTLANNPMLLDIGGNADKQSYRAGPGKVLHANGDTLKPFVLPDMAGGLYRDQQFLDRDIEEVSGAPPLLSGQQQPGVGSATEFAGLTQQAGVQIIKYAHAIEDTLIKPVLSLYHRYNQQLLPKDVAVRMVGEDGLDFMSIQREDTLVDLEFLITGASSMQSRSVLGAQWGVLLPQFMQFAMLSPGSVDVEALFGRILKDVFAFDHPELYVRGVRKTSKVRSPEEVFLLLTQGQRLVPDPRADLYTQLKTLGGYVVQYGGELRRPVLDNVLEYMEQATQALQLQMAQAVAAQQQRLLTTLANKAATPAGPKNPADTGEGRGGEGNTSTKGTDRDGKGMTEGRTAMKAMRPVGQGA